MGSYIECACNGCAECIGCGRKHEYYTYFECDKCGAGETELFVGINGEELCFECYKNQFLSKICDDMDETKCARCGADAEEMFNLEGEWVCEDCLYTMAEKVEE